MGYRQKVGSHTRPARRPSCPGEDGQRWEEAGRAGMEPSSWVLVVGCSGSARACAEEDRVNASAGCTAVPGGSAPGGPAATRGRSRCRTAPSSGNQK